MCLYVSRSFSQPGVEKEHKTFLFHRATAFKLRLRVCMVLMTRRLQMFWSARVFLRVCDHLQHDRYVMLPSSCNPRARGKLKRSNPGINHQPTSQAK